MYYPYFKNLLDYTGALLLLVILCPILLVFSLILMIQNHGTPFFLQERNGKDERPFWVIKFKTMTDETDNDGNLLPNSKRLTPLGTIIRKSSIDELPQLFNILKGDMSFIGPRPLPARYLPYFTDEERVRFEVKPGISGLAQVSGRNLVHWDKRLSLDVEYVENLSFKTEVQILYKTIINVFNSEDLVVDPTTTMIDLDKLRNGSKRERVNS